MKETLTTGSPFVFAVLSEETGFQVATQLDGLAALALLNMASEGLLGEMMKPDDETEH